MDENDLEDDGFVTQLGTATKNEQLVDPDNLDPPSVLLPTHFPPL